MCVLLCDIANSSSYYFLNKNEIIYYCAVERIWIFWCVVFCFVLFDVRSLSSLMHWCYYYCNVVIPNSQFSFPFLQAHFIAFFLSQSVFLLMFLSLLFRSLNNIGKPLVYLGHKDIICPLCNSLFLLFPFTLFVRSISVDNLFLVTYFFFTPFGLDFFSRRGRLPITANVLLRLVFTNFRK